ncbi:hypothetical protein BX661DRAFT_183733 [Kickxella alabastrina]|uniref:uncharacterized protein n=1 Tax=Kickxella alabastrina TaxID=61397 RepID=UPI002220F7B1|nr:uncharacterized protein BX661DRAFT_183733 [Kickxella alabastrina]KAI7826275.1 hypothetical protein BX661DRAFT_183733 [Kickxella alabastrina]
MSDQRNYASHTDKPDGTLSKFGKLIRTITAMQHRPSKRTYAHDADCDFELDTTPNVQPLEAGDIGYGGGIAGQGAVPMSVQRDSVRAESLRKREKVAEMRRKRQQQQQPLGAIGELSVDAPGSVRSAAAPRAAAAASLATLFGPPLGPVEDGGGMAEASSADIAEMEADGARLVVQAQAQAAAFNPADERFFNSPELDLLLHEIDAAPLVFPAEPPAHLAPASPAADAFVGAIAGRPLAEGARRAASFGGSLAARTPPARGESGFIINIPSTSLSPVVPFGVRRVSDEGGLSRVASARLHHGRLQTNAQQLQSAKDGGRTAADRRGSGREVDGCDDGDGDGDRRRDDDVLEQLREEMDMNRELRGELARLNDVINAVVNMAQANKTLCDINRKHQV